MLSEWAHSTRSRPFSGRRTPRVRGADIGFCQGNVSNAHPLLTLAVSGCRTSASCAGEFTQSTRCRRSACGAQRPLLQRVLPVAPNRRTHGFGHVPVTGAFGRLPSQGPVKDWRAIERKPADRSFGGGKRSVRGLDSRTEQATRMSAEKYARLGELLDRDPDQLGLRQVPQGLGHRSVAGRGTRVPTSRVQPSPHMPGRTTRSALASSRTACTSP